MELSLKRIFTRLLLAQKADKQVWFYVEKALFCYLPQFQKYPMNFPRELLTTCISYL